MQSKSTIFASLAAAALCLGVPHGLRADDVSNQNDPTKHHHYANPDGNLAFSDPNNVIPDHYNYDLYHDQAADGQDGVTWQNPEISNAPETAQGSPGTWSETQSGQGSGNMYGSAPNQAPAPWNKAGNLIGMIVLNQRTQTLGTIRDVVFDLPSGRVSYVVLEKANPAPGSGLDVAVPLTSFRPAPDNTHLILRTNRDRLENARGFSFNNYPPIGNSSHVAQPTVEEEDIFIVPPPAGSHRNQDWNQNQGQDQYRQSSPDWNLNRDNQDNP